MNTEQDTQDDVVEVPANSPAHDAVAAAREEQAATPVSQRIEIPNMDPDAAAEMTQRAIRTVAEQAQVDDQPLDYSAVPAVMGHEQWEQVGGSITALPQGQAGQEVLVIEIVYIPSIADMFVAAILAQIAANHRVSQRGTAVHEELRKYRQGHDYDDGLPEEEKLEDSAVEKMGGKPDVNCPDCGANLDQGSHKTDCPRAAHDISSLPPYEGGARK